MGPPPPYPNQPASVLDETHNTQRVRAKLPRSVTSHVVLVVELLIIQRVFMGRKSAAGSLEPEGLMDR
jgi:hypothetical protein